MININNLAFFVGRNFSMNNKNFKILSIDDGDQVQIKELRGNGPIVEMSKDKLQNAEPYIPLCGIRIKDWTGRILYEGEINTLECAEVLNANRKHENDGPSYEDIDVQWRDDLEDENVYEHLNDY